MGLRGIGARTKATREAAVVRVGDRPWEVPGLSRAERVIAFVESLRVTSGVLAGQKFKLRPFQRTIVEAWYATDEKGRLVVRTGLLSEARKNGKTGLCAALALCHLLGPEQEKRGQICVGASDRDQSGLIFDELVAFINDNADFADRVNIKRHEKTIEELDTGSKFRALSSDAKKAHGLSPSVVILDELAQWGTGAGRGLYDALTTAGGARRDPLVLIIGTQSPDEHNLMSQLVDYAKSVRDGVIVDPSFSGFVYEIPAELDVFEEANWILANPAIDDFRDRQDMRNLAERARHLKTMEAPFRNLFCNQRVAAEGRWIPMPMWDACAGELDPVALEQSLYGKQAWTGLDLSSTSDLTAYLMDIPLAAGKHAWIARFWMPKENIARRVERDKVPYDIWAQEGWIKVTSGNVVDYDVVRADINELHKKFHVVEIAIDRWNATQLSTQLMGDGFVVAQFGQGFASMSAPSKELEKLILGSMLVHGGHPVLQWMASNVVVDQDAAGNIKPAKNKSGEKIDGIVAGIMGLGRAIAQQAPQPIQAFVI